MGIWRLLRSLVLWSVVGMIGLCTSGCTVDEMASFLGLNNPDEALFVISFHRKVSYPRGNLQGEQLLHLPDGREVIIERYPLFSSHQVVEVAAQPVPGKAGFYRLHLRPDQKGKMMWMQLTAMSRQDQVYILLDGIHFGEFEAASISRGNERWVELPLDVDAARALNIVKYANDNYRYFNDGAKDDESPFAQL